MNRERTATIAEDVIDGMDPSLTEDQRLTALNHALALDPTTALAMATSFGQALIETLGELGLSSESVMENLRLRAAQFRKPTTN
jgi:hypothetical protein